MNTFRRWLLRGNGNLKWFLFIVAGAVICEVGIENLSHNAEEIASVFRPVFKR